MFRIETAARVDAGAKFLDQHHPGWDQLIDLARLNLESSDDCVLGQLYGSYGRGLDRLFPRKDGVIPERYPLGFTEPDMSNYGELNRAWERLIMDRQYAVIA